MTVTIPYEALIALIEQLPAQQQHELLVRLLKRAKARPLSKEEKRALFHASILSVPVNEVPSVRREDWYDDDGR